MAADAALLGLAIVLTLATGLGLAKYESFATLRAWRLRGLSRPGAVALLVGFGLATLVTGKLTGNFFLVPAEATAAISGLGILRRGGRLTSFGILWASAILVVVTLDADIPAFGAAWADVTWTAFLLACFCSLLRELDVTGAYGWFVALTTAATTAGLAYYLDRADDATLAVLVTGAVFATIATAPFGGGLLGRVGARFLGLAIGGIAIRLALDSPGVMIGVAAAGVVCVFGFIATLDNRVRLRATLGLVAVAGAFGLAAVPAVAALLDEHKPLRNAVQTSRDLVKVNPDPGLESVSARLASIELTFRSSERRLSSPAVSAGKFVPFLGANLRAAASSAQVAADLAASARRLVDQVTVNKVAMKNGTVKRADLDRLVIGLRGVRTDVRHARTRMVRTRALDLLVPELRDGVKDLRDQVERVDDRVRSTLDGTVAATRLLGFDRTRRYFIAVQNNAESRATGGYIANYGILFAKDGKVSLPAFRRTSEFDAPSAKPRILRAPKDYTRRYSRFDVDREWTNVNMSPDFPTVAKVMVDQYEQFRGVKVDGVLAVDPIALSKLLALTGPVTVAGWPVPITASNVVAVTLHDEYVAFNNRPDDRVDFIGRVAKTVFDRLTNSGLADLVRAGSVIHDATRTRHIQFWTNDRSASFFRATNSDGHVPALRGDAVLVTTQNAAGNKTDYFLHRSIAYDAQVRRGDGGLAVESTLTITLRNDAPATGEPKYVIGPYDARFKPGQNRTYLTVYSPLGLRGATIDGQPLQLLASPEHGRTARSTFVEIPSGGTRTIEVRLSGIVRGSARYVLDIGHQPLVFDDQVRLAIDGAGPDGALRFNGALSRDVRIDVPLRKK